MFWSSPDESWISMRLWRRANLQRMSTAPRERPAISGTAPGMSCRLQRGAAGFEIPWKSRCEEKERALARQGANEVRECECTQNDATRKPYQKLLWLE
jgi:hypothetical protein